MEKIIELWQLVHRFAEPIGKCALVIFLLLVLIGVLFVIHLQMNYKRRDKEAELDS